MRDGLINVPVGGTADRAQCAVGACDGLHAIPCDEVSDFYAPFGIATVLGLAVAALVAGGADVSTSPRTGWGEGTFRRSEHTTLVPAVSRCEFPAWRLKCA